MLGFFVLLQPVCVYMYDKYVIFILVITSNALDYDFTISHSYLLSILQPFASGFTTMFVCLMNVKQKCTCWCFSVADAKTYYEMQILGACSYHFTLVFCCLIYPFLKIKFFYSYLCYDILRDRS